MQRCKTPRSIAWPYGLRIGTYKGNRRTLLAAAQIADTP